MPPSVSAQVARMRRYKIAGNALLNALEELEPHLTQPPAPSPAKTTASATDNGKMRIIGSLSAV